MTVIYEWDVETALNDVDEDIIDHRCFSDLSEAVQFFKLQPEPGTFKRIVLVRDDDDCRAWAYMDGAELPEQFVDAWGDEYKAVPKRFHAEVKRQKPSVFDSLERTK